MYFDTLFQFVFSKSLSSCPNVLRSHVLEVSSGADIVESVNTYGQRGRGVSVLSGNGTVANVVLRQPVTIHGNNCGTGAGVGGVVTLHGKFDIIPSLTVLVLSSVRGLHSCRNGDPTKLERFMCFPEAFYVYHNMIDTNTFINLISLIGLLECFLHDWDFKLPGGSSVKDEEDSLKVSCHSSTGRRPTGRYNPYIGTRTSRAQTSHVGVQTELHVLAPGRCSPHVKSAVAGNRTQVAVLTAVSPLPPELDVSVKRTVKETMEKAFWDSVMESMKLEEPDYSCISNLMREVRDELCQMVPDSWKVEITETIDLDLLSQLLNSGTLDIDYLGKMLEFALATLRKLSAPANDRENESTHHSLLEELHWLCQAKDESGSLHAVAIVKGIRFILEKIHDLKQEIGIGRIL
ncbi:hypothetical protein Bca52824_073067 [Brassica carinata]|uniref:Uncharacterized protein n=1 Tax=Brassica carinata TaxID=52824 RepID=A0A8X7Q9X1_BRACI|nr:hypothetical protein Bca52824_073067 [Brassica carinata]